MHLPLVYPLVAGLLFSPCLASLLSPRGVQCSYETTAADGDTCESLAASWASTADHFAKINPGVTCPDLEAGRLYCVLGEWTPGGDSTTTTSVTTTRSTTVRTTTAAAPSNSPTMPGVAKDCDRFYKIKSGDYCDGIASANGITFDQLMSWNTRITAACNTLLPGYFICVHAPGASGPAPTTPANTAPAATNTPTMPGIARDCDRFHKIKSGDVCDTIASANGITTDQLLSWNTGINDACNNLLLGYHVCVHVPGTAAPPPPSTPTTTAGPTNGISTPVPTQPGMVSNCDRFYQVKAGDNCAAIAAAHGITLERFVSWNTGAGSDCRLLQLRAHTCVRTIGYVEQSSLQCAGDGWAWGDNKPAVHQAVTSWCDGRDQSDGSGGFGPMQAKEGCFNTPLGHHTIRFWAQNNFGVGTALPQELCERILHEFVDRCPRGGSGTHAGWAFSGSVPQGRC